MTCSQNNEIESDAALAVSRAAAALRGKLAVEIDPDKRLQALLLCYGQYAQIHAAAFVADLLASRGSQPHRTAEDLSEHAQIVVDELKNMLLSDLPAELSVPEFRSGTEQLVDRVFFYHFNALIAAAPAQGSA